MSGAAGPPAGRGPIRFRTLLVGLVVGGGAVVALRFLAFPPETPQGSPAPIRIPGAPISPPSKSPATRSPSPGAFGWINPEYPGLTTFRGNWTRTFFGIGPVPVRPKIKWRAGPWCGRSEDLGVVGNWCGTGWNGQPNVVPLGADRVEVRVGGYDFNYHFLDGYTGRKTRPPLHTGDLAKGSATSDPDGCPLYYVGSRDDRFRIVALDRKRPRVLWSLDSETSVPDPRWNSDWDGAAQVVGDYLLLGGENSWFYVIKLNKVCRAEVRVDPRIVFRAPGWDAQLLRDLRGNQNPADLSIENSIAYDDTRKVAYFGNGGGLVQGWDISKILRGGSQARRVFRYWMGGENDASIVIAPDGDLIASAHYRPPNPRAQQVGQLIRLDPRKRGNPVVWRLRESGTVNGEAGFFSTPALVGDVLYASANDGELMAINAETGKVLWKKRLISPLWSGPTVVDGVLVIGDCSGTLYAFDVTGRRPSMLWKLRLGGCIESTPAVWDGWVYVGTRSGYFYGIGDKRPARLRPNATPTPIPG